MCQVIVTDSIDTVKIYSENPVI